MKILAKLAPLSLALALGGCGPEEPSVRYSGNTLPPKALQHVKVYRATRPERPFEELGTVQASCPTKAQAGMFGSVHIEGGCTLETALQMAVERAAMAGADGLVGLDTTAGGNGNVVALTAVALR